MIANAPAHFTIETSEAGEGELSITIIQNKTGKKVDTEITPEDESKTTYNCIYVPEEEGDYVINITWSGTRIPKSPFTINVQGFAGDPSKVTCKPFKGVKIKERKRFDISAKGAGNGEPSVIILDPKGKKDSVPVKITPLEDEVYKCEFVPKIDGMHYALVFFAGIPIPASPIGFRVAKVSK